MGDRVPNKTHYARNMSMMWGADPADGLWASMAVDADGYLYAKTYVKDPGTLLWVPAVQGLKASDTLAVSGPLTDTQLRNSDIKITLDSEAVGMKYIATGGVSTEFKSVDGKPRISSMPYTYDIAEGNVTDHRSWGKIGFNGAIGATEEEMWPVSTPYVWPTGALTMTIVSDSAEDDADKTPAAGTGAYTVDVYYLTTAFAEKMVTVTMNGTGAVQIATDIYRVQNARIMTAGTALTAVGNLTIASGGTTYGYISAGRTRMRQCTWTVPAGKTLYITQIAFSCADQAASKYARFTTKANFDNLSGTILPRGLWSPYNEVVLNNTAYWRELNPPTKLPATVDLKVSAMANSAAVGTCSLRGWLE